MYFPKQLLLYKKSHVKIKSWNMCEGWCGGKAGFIELRVQEKAWKKADRGTAVK